MYLKEGKKEQCCGCMACSRVCPVSAIQMQEDEKGFFYPVIDREKCVGCKRCEAVCPMQENYVGQAGTGELYAVKNKDVHTVEQSSSGGMFTLLAEWIVAREGAVYGVAFDRSFCVRHMRGTTSADISGFRTSKYVESNMGEVYAQLEEDLNAGRLVLFTGTPCQVSAVKKYLKTKKIKDEKLYTCDNICHGVPSHRVWEDYLIVLREKYMPEESFVEAINMRSKRRSWKQKDLEIRLKEGTIDEITEEFSYNKLYETLQLHRLSCFNCKYTSYRRPSDFTLGDFWNTENVKPAFEMDRGVNELLVNTEKGKKLFEELRSSMEIQSLTQKEGWQPHLEYSSGKPSGWERFWTEYERTADKEVVMRKYIKGSVMARIIRRVTPILRKTGLYGLAGRMYKAVFARK